MLSQTNGFKVISGESIFGNRQIIRGSEYRYLHRRHLKQTAEHHFARNGSRVAHGVTVCLLARPAVWQGVCFREETATAACSAKSAESLCQSVPSQQAGSEARAHRLETSGSNQSMGNQATPPMLNMERNARAHPSPASAGILSSLPS